MCNIYVRHVYALYIVDVQIVDFLLAVLRNSELEMNTRDVASLVISNFGEVKSKDLVKTNKIPAILSVMVSHSLQLQ
jgi:cell division protein ZapA (FtsZ GTPase activity inhibitor)